jgi:hypothetical protein
MRRYIETEHVVNRKECIEAFCNKCGESKGDATEMSLYFGYGSSFDMQKWSFDLCDDCVSEIVNSFVIPVEKNKEYF